MKTKLLKKVLLCRPLFYNVSYSINPWMIPGSVDLNKAQDQWERLVEVYQGLDVEVSVIDQKQNLPDMVFATDQAIVYNKIALLSNFRYKERRGENVPYSDWFKRNNYSVKNAAKDIFFEGTGECLFFRDILFAGHGFRSSKKAAKYIQDELQIEVISLKLTNPNFYHLDTALFPLNDTTAFFYPEAFDQPSLETLKKVVTNLIPFSKTEAHSFAANSVVTDHHVVMPTNIPTFKDKVKNLGYKAVEVDMSEYIKSGGAAHCLTSVLQEEYE